MLKHTKGNLITHVKGNLINLAEKGEFDIIVHGCNCLNSMSGGLALEIRNRYPECSKIDSNTDRGNVMKLGNWTSYNTGKFIIINAYTQFDVGREDSFNHNAFGLILDKLEHIHGYKRIGLPYIGMGLAMVNPKIITILIERFARKVSKQGGSVTLVKFG